MSRKKPIILCILDGWGITKDKKYSAIAKAHTPIFDEISQTYPYCELEASGKYVGLPEGQMGNSEVGHMNIGAGKVVMQDLPRINDSVKNNTLKNCPALQNLISKLKQTKGVCHLLGLLSDGGVHSHLNHIITLAKIIADSGIKVCVHGFLDGRDTPQKSALDYIKRFNDAISKYSNIKLSTIGGRYYGMDRDNRWERIEKAYNVLVSGDSINSTKDLVSAVENSYSKNKTDEFVEPVVLEGYKGMQDNDAFIFCNFRADRARQITIALGNSEFKEFNRKKVVKFCAKAQMTEYSSEHSKFLETLFPSEKVENSLGEIISQKGLKQLRIAETEKYAHVTFFFSGGREKEFKGEERILIPSPKVATYDLQPEMSANELKDKLIEQIQLNKFDFILVNFANPDMVGHTGIMDAAIKACEEVDKDLGEIIEEVKKQDGLIFVTADHGNAEQMRDFGKDIPYTAHTINKVPFILVGNDVGVCELKGKSLSDIAGMVLRVGEF